MTEDLSVIANFNLQNQPVHLQVKISGRGRVTSSLEALNCREPCSCGAFARVIFLKDNVTLGPIPESGWLFGGWEGDCEDGSVTMDDEKPAQCDFSRAAANPVGILKLNFEVDFDGDGKTDLAVWRPLRAPGTSSSAPPVRRRAPSGGRREISRARGLRWR